MASVHSSPKQDGQTSEKANEDSKEAEEQSTTIDQMMTMTELPTNEDTPELVLLPGEYQRTIINAYLLLKYKVVTKEKMLCREFAFMAYSTLLLQVVALVLLTRLIMLQSGVQAHWGPDAYGVRVAPFEQSIYVFPFMIIGLIAGFYEAQCCCMDIALWNREKNLCREISRREMKCLKCMEGLVTFIGIIGYYMVIAKYSVHNWDGTLSTILNILAYQFIFAVDDYVYAFVHVRLQTAHLRSASTDGLDDLFKGQYNAAKNGALYSSLYWVSFTYSCVIFANYIGRAWTICLGIFPLIACVAFLGKDLKVKSFFS